MAVARAGVWAWVRTYLVALVVAIAVLVAGLVGVNRVYDQKVDNIERVENLDLDENTDAAEPANFLLIGSDTRAFVENPEQEEAFGDPEVETGQRSDTVMVVHVDPEARTGLLVSFPRDLVVNIRGEGEQKINAAYNFGPQKVIDTIWDNFQIPIHHYLEVDFASFEGIVNAVGGVPIYFPAPARDEQTGLSVSFFGAEFPGCFELDGAAALAYVRSRSYEQEIDGEWVSDEKNDFGRIERQQQFLRRLAAEAVATALRNPLRANRIANEGLSELKADEELDRTDINKLIQGFRGIDPDNRQTIETVTVLTENDPSYGDLGNVQLLLPAENEPLFARLRTFEEPAATTTTPEGPPPSSIRVRVLNASDVGGIATETDAALTERGFRSGGVGNTDGVAETEVRYRPGAKAEAEVVKGLLTGGVGRLVKDDSIVEADVQLVLGADFEGIAPPPDAPTSTDPGEPATTAVPDTTAGESAPPSGTEDEVPSVDCN